MKFKLATLALASLFAVGANATTTDWGVHDLLEVGVAITPVGAFDDFYLFSVTGDHAVFSTAVENDLTNVLGIDNGMVTLFQDMGNSNTQLGSFAYTDLTGNISHSFGTLGTGNYLYEVTGIGTGTQGGFYSITSTAAPVPEPQTYALFLGGLGAIGFMLRRRQA